MPKTKEQCEKLKQDRINAIYSHSLYLFAMKGYEGVSTNEITNATNCSHGLLYHYFKSKDELFKALINEVAIENEKVILKDVRYDQSAKLLVKDLLDAYLNALKSSNDDYPCTIYLLLNLYLQRTRTPKIKSVGISNETYKTFFMRLYEAVERGKKEGDFNDYPTLELVVAMAALLKGITYNRLNLGHKNFTCPKSEIIMKMILKEGGNQC